MLKKKMLIALGVAPALSVGCVRVTAWAEENAEDADRGSGGQF